LLIGPRCDGVTPRSYTVGYAEQAATVAVTASRELIDALERVRLATGTREADATLVRRLRSRARTPRAWSASRRTTKAQELFLGAIDRGDVAWCWPVRYELMIDARDSEAIAVLDRMFEGLREIAVDRAVQRGVLSVMPELAAAGSAATVRSELYQGSGSA
jgi:hypothetical protein